MNDIITRTADLPATIGGYTVRDRNGDYNIFLNSRLSRERQLESYQHELDHIRKDDFSGGSVQEIETKRHT